MRQTEVTRLAHELMQKHGLTSGGWTFGFNRRKKGLALCDYRKKEISLSVFHLDRAESDIRNSILHEVAHAKCGPGAGHGPMWKSIFLAIGGTGERCGNGNDVAFTWIGKCPKCGKESGFHRAPLRIRSCGLCSKTFQPENVLVWYKNGRRVNVAAMPQRYVAEATRMRQRYGDRLPV